MLSFFNFLIEQINPTDDKSKKSPDALGKVHEHLVTEFLGGEISAQDRKQHIIHKKKIGSLQYAHALVRAKHAADQIKDTVIGKKPVAKIVRVSQTKTPDDPSDLHIHFANGKKVGISLKSTTEKKAAKDKSIRLSNPGLESINSIHGQKIKKHPDRQQHLWNIANKASIGFNNASEHDRKQYLTKHIFRIPKSHDVYGVHTLGGTSPSTAVFKYRQHFTPYINDVSKIKAKRSGNTINFHHPLSKTPIFSLRLKYRDAEENSPIKASVTTTLPKSLYKR